MPLTIEQYLEKIGRFVDEPFAKQLRKQFKDNRGSSELAVLQSPSREEYEQLCRLTAILTPQEKVTPISWPTCRSEAGRRRES
jgi:hypothetical protein